MANFQEPPFNPHDTQPTITITPPDQETKTNSWLGWGLLGMASLLTLGTVVVTLLPHPANTITVAENPILTLVPTQTIVPTDETQPTVVTTINTLTDTQPSLLPTVNAQQISLLLQSPIITLRDGNDGTSLKYDPFTLIPERPRSEFIQYSAVSGDTIDAISQRYALKPESLAWCNDRSIIFVLRPGDILRIPPVDGACHVVLGTRQETIASIAEQYEVTAQELANSPYGNFYELSVDTVLPGGTEVFIPNGQGELITWNPPLDVEKDDTGRVIGVSFGIGQAGSCGRVDPGGGAAWGNPLPNGTWVRGFSVGHTGIDISAPTGTPIYAANSGPVLFSGFSSWGYGEAVVLGHGPFSTLYGHMSQRSVSCGQYVSVGQVVGLVGSTGNSSGPHLHFEIRSGEQPQNPSGTPGIGW
jgi:murein DD-endopeptidase MepM/ murein hydrolase activator NlpD